MAAFAASTQANWPCGDRRIFWRSPVASATPNAGPRHRRQFFGEWIGFRLDLAAADDAQFTTGAGFIDIITLTNDLGRERH